MYKVFFVEDEASVRKAIRDNIDWQAEGLLFCGDAGDGESALPLILKEKPDILLTDIKMPFRDGLELTRMAKKELPKLIVIILSGYDEFRYAQQALKLAVDDYILKPITPQKLVKTLAGAVRTLENRHDELRKQAVLAKAPETATPRLERETDMRELVAGEGVVDRDAMRSVIQFAGKAEGKSLAMRIAGECEQACGSSRMYFGYCVFDAVTTAHRVAKEIGIELLRSQLPESIERNTVTKEEFAELLSGLLCKTIDIRDSMSDRNTRLVATAQSFMERNCHNPELCLGMVAEQVRVSPNYLSGVLSRETGETFSEQLNKLRIKKAMVLLKSTDDKAEQVAERVGYNDQQYFAKMFKKIIGITPREYRKM